VKKIVIFIFILLADFAGMANAENPQTFDQAKALSGQQDKPLLIDFFVDW
jgi:hypothetical protein